MTKQLGGRYELLERIGDGGMAVVYRAMDTILGRTVAVKMLRSQYASDEEFVNCFRQEAQSAARLSHPNIVNLYDIGMMDGEYYIVMEYVDGQTLKDVIRDRGPLSVKESLDITGQICDALEHAHDHHIIHRDIKPHNILIGKNGRVKVTDFGIARAITGNTITHQPSHSVLGSVHYFSPEQARGGTTDVKSDIYSLGIVMYEMLTKQLPFSGDSPVSVALKHLRDDFVEPRMLDKSIPQSVENIVLRCLVKSPELRYPNMRALKVDLKDALLHPNVPKFVMPREVADETISVPAVGPGTGLLQLEKPAHNSHAKPNKKRWWVPVMWTGVALAVLCLGALAAYYIILTVISVPNLNLPSVVGKTEPQAVAMLEKANFSASQIHEKRGANANYPKGEVYAQDPAGPTQVKQTRQVTLYVSTGQPQVKLPNLEGIPVSQAIQQLQNQGIVASNIKQQKVFSDQISAGDVVDTTPAAGMGVGPNDTVTLDVSQGAQTTVPNVLGMTEQDATSALQAANLTVGRIYRMPYNGIDQTVYKTGPYGVGQPAPVGTAIDLYIVNNSGESGGGLQNPNSTGPASGGYNQGGGQPTMSGSLPPGTHAIPAVIKVPDNNGQSLDVKILKSDATGTNQFFTEQTITQATTWTLTLYLSPQTTGQVLVYENGKLVHSQTVPFQ